MEWTEMLLVAVAGVFVGFVNTVAGGGSLLILPLLIFTGLTPAAANATNRIAVLVQSFTGMMGFQQKQLINYKLALPLGISALFGAIIGAMFSLEIDEQTFKRVIAIVIVVVVFMMLFKSKSYSAEEAQKQKSNAVGLIIFFLLGIYGGFLQAGIGFGLMAALNRYYKIDLVRTNAIKVTVVLIFNLAAFSIFLYAGLIHWKVGLILAAGNAVGAWWASQWSIKRGEKGIRVVVGIMAVVMAIKLWFFPD